MMIDPLDLFFSSGSQSSSSPFLTHSSLKIATNLSLRRSLFSFILLVAAYISAYYLPPLGMFLLLFVYVISGFDACVASIIDLIHLRINIDVLMTLAAFLSAIIGAQYEGALLLVLFDISGAMEDAVSKKAMGALRSLEELSPSFASVVKEDGSTIQRSVREIQIGEKLLVKAGDVIPLDGVVIEGNSFLNMVHLTGESVPIGKKPGDPVAAGSRNLDGALTVLVQKTSYDSTLSQIIKLIRDASESKPRAERFFDTFSRIYSTTIISLFFIFALGLPLVFSIPFFGIEGSLYRSLAFLIAASPCALIIATPTAYLSALSSCAKRGIIVKGGAVLDAFTKIKRLAFDKTGTLTTGKLSCVNFEHLSGESSPAALSAAYALEMRSSHPIADAIVEYAQQKGIKPITLTEFLHSSGLGLEGKFEHEGASYSVVIGRASFVGYAGPSYEGMHTYLKVGSGMYRFSFTDTLRNNIHEIIAKLQHSFDLIMLTGDHKLQAETVARTLGITQFFSDLTPEAKVEKVSLLSKESPLAMVGDGINDAPALARAHVGISMGKVGTVSAQDASDVILLQDDLSAIEWLKQKSDATFRLVLQNIILALSVIFLATTPALLGEIPLWLAVLLHEGGTVIVGLNSLRLLKK